MQHDSRFTRSTPPNDPPRMGVAATILTLIGGVVALNIVALFSPELAFVAAAALIAAAVIFFVSALIRKN